MSMFNTIKLMRLLYIFLFISLFFTGFTGNPHKTNSVLATGSWYKISVKESGIHKITYDDFVNMGVDVAALNTSTIRVFGNGGGMLPENNSSFFFSGPSPTIIHLISSLTFLRIEMDLIIKSMCLKSNNLPV